MKTIHSILFLFLPFMVWSQNLENTVWQTYNPSLFDTIRIEIGADTVNQYIGKDSLLVTSLYDQSNDTVAIFDVGGSLQCPGNDTGIYRFTIVDDTLSLFLIVDNCLVRSISYDGVKAWRVYDYTGISSVLIQKPSFSYFPNPSNGLITLNLPGRGQLQVYNQNAQLVFVDDFDTGQTSLQLPLSQGFYFLKYQSEEGIFSDKLFIK